MFCFFCGGPNSYSFSEFASIFSNKCVVFSKFVLICCTLWTDPLCPLQRTLPMGRVSYPSHEILQIWKQSASAIQEKNYVAILETRVSNGSSYLCQRFWPGVTECDFEVNLGMWSSLKQLLFKSKLRRKIQSTGPFWGQSFVAICFDFLWFYDSYGSHVFCLPVEVGWQEMQFWKLDLEKGGCLTCVLQTFGVAFAHGATAVLVPCLPASVTWIGGH